MSTFDCVVAALASLMLGGWLLRAIDRHNQQREASRRELKRAAIRHAPPEGV